MATPVTPAPPSAPPGRQPARGRWADQTSLFQVREPAFWLYVLVVATTGVAALGQQSALGRISAAGWALSWALLLAYALPVMVAVYLLDLYEREPPSLVVGAVVWGAVAATTLAAIANAGWGAVVARVGGPEFASRWTAALTAPVTEEILKATGVVLIYLIARDEIDGAMDGFVYGAMCGLGFAVMEDVFYFLGVFGGDSSGVFAGFLVRVVSGGLYGHVLYSGLAGMGMGSLVSSGEEVPKARRWVMAIGLVLAAVGGHFLWNSPLLDLFPSELSSMGDWLRLVLASAVKGVPLLSFLALLVVLARRQEDRWLGALLREEEGGPALLEGETEELSSPRARRRARRDMRARAGAPAAVLLRRLQRELVNLAMMRARVPDGDDPDLVRQRQYCTSLREALMAIPGAAPAGGDRAGDDD